jgi:hypothetical protein
LILLIIVLIFLFTFVMKKIDFEQMVVINGGQAVMTSAATAQPLNNDALFGLSTKDLNCLGSALCYIAACGSGFCLVGLIAVVGTAALVAANC